MDDSRVVGDENVAISTMSILSFRLIKLGVIINLVLMELLSGKLEWMQIKNRTVDWSPEEKAHLSKGGFPQVHE